jgi:hypothetical protein
VTTVLHHLCEKVRAAGGAVDGSAPPVAILWTDPQRQFAPAIGLLKQQLPELLELGGFDPIAWRGPAIWVRCVVDGSLPRRPEASDRIPIVYLPGVARQHLRAGEDCPEELRPLVELLYRGYAWVHQGGHDHTLSAFLKSQSHLGLDVAEDAATNGAIVNAVREVLSASVASLRGRRLEAGDFNKLVAGDTVRDLLRWIGDPHGVKQGMTAERWLAFTHSVQSEFGLRPEVDGALTAAELLCKSEGSWDLAWQRFEEAPDSYPGLVDALARVEPAAQGLFANADARKYLQVNDREEAELEDALADLQGVQRPEVCAAVLELEKRHGPRRKSVWARLGRARLANALAPLAELAAGVKTPLGGVTPDDFARGYEKSGWRTDLALLDVTAAIDGKKDESVLEVAQHLATEWLDAGARAFQKAVAASPLPGAATAPVVSGQEGTCILFVDGLRYDLGRLLSEALEGVGCRVDLKSRWAALPTVTATAKPAVTPVAGDIEGRTLEQTFAPVLKSNGKPADAAALRAVIKDRGGQVIAAGEFAMPQGASLGGWHEAGEIDSLGHKLNARLAREVRSEVRRVAEVVQSLLDAGWQAVRVVTDHGWLLMPGGLPKVDLPKHLASTKWSRCALLQGATPAGVELVHWHWNAQHTVATPPGVACFTSGQEYAHGGVSIQECLIPDLTVTRAGGGGGAQPGIASVGWLKYRCIVDTRNATPETRVDIRVDAPTGKSVLKSPKSPDADGSASIPVEDEYEKKQLVVVLLDAAGTVIAQRKTRVGESA